LTTLQEDTPLYIKFGQDFVRISIYKDHSQYYTPVPAYAVETFNSVTQNHPRPAEIYAEQIAPDERPTGRPSLNLNRDISQDPAQKSRTHKGQGSASSKTNSDRRKGKPQKTIKIGAKTSSRKSLTVAPVKQVDQKRINLEQRARQVLKHSKTTKQIRAIIKETRSYERSQLGDFVNKLENPPKASPIRKVLNAASSLSNSSNGSSQSSTQPDQVNPELTKSSTSNRVSNNLPSEELTNTWLDWCANDSSATRSDDSVGPSYYPDSPGYDETDGAVKQHFLSKDRIAAIYAHQEIADPESGKKATAKQKKAALDAQAAGLMENHPEMATKTSPVKNMSRKDEHAFVQEDVTHKSNLPVKKDIITDSGNVYDDPQPTIDTSEEIRRNQLANLTLDELREAYVKGPSHSAVHAGLSCKDYTHQHELDNGSGQD